MAKKLPGRGRKSWPKAKRYEVSDGGTGLYVETRPTGGQSYLSATGGTLSRISSSSARSWLRIPARDPT